MSFFSVMLPLALQAGAVAFVSPAEWAASRIAAGERRILALEVMLPERGVVWLIPGVRCGVSREIINPAAIQAVAIDDAYASPAELELVETLNVGLMETGETALAGSCSVQRNALIGLDEELIPDIRLSDIAAK